MVEEDLADGQGTRCYKRVAAGCEEVSCIDSFEVRTLIERQIGPVLVQLEQHVACWQPRPLAAAELRVRRIYSGQKISGS
jgi:hypothetical protein